MDSISVTYHDDKDGSTKTVRVPLGTNLLEAAHANNVDLEGACECSLACSTCHVIVDPTWIGIVGEPSAQESSMLDLNPDRQPNSRLSCQIAVTDKVDGLVVQLPEFQY